MKVAAAHHPSRVPTGHVVVVVAGRPCRGGGCGGFTGITTFHRIAAHLLWLGRVDQVDSVRLLAVVLPEHVL